MSGVKGAARTRRLLKRLPDTLRDELGRDMVRAGPQILAAARGGAPRRTGQLQQLLTWRFYARTLRLRVGLLTAGARRGGWYGRILESGRKAQTVQVKRRTANGVIAYALRVSPIAGARYDIVEGRVRRFARGLLGPRLNAIFDRALRKASTGGAE